MTWTYGGDPSLSQRDELRFLVADTDNDVPLLSDEEIAYLIGKWLPVTDSMTMVAAVAAASIGRKFAGITSISGDGVTINVSDISKNYFAMAAQLRAEAELGAAGGEVDMGGVMLGDRPDPGIKPLVFGLGMNDNIEAGQQDYGTSLYWTDLIMWAPEPAT